MGTSLFTSLVPGGLKFTFNSMDTWISLKTLVKYSPALPDQSLQCLCSRSDCSLKDSKSSFACLKKNNLFVCFQNEVPTTLASMGIKIGDQVCIGGNKVQVPGLLSRKKKCIS